MKALSWGVAGAAAAALLAPPAGAVTRCVNTTGTGGCLSSIQTAVNASAAGDIIMVRPGAHGALVTIPAGKDRLQIVGAGIGVTILDPLGSPVITINSNSVKVQSLTIRNSEGILVNGNAAVLQGLELVNVIAGSGMFFAPSTTGHQVLANTLRGVNLNGIILPSANDGSVVRGNRVGQVVGFAIMAAGSDLKILSNRITDAGDGISVAGNRAQVTGNVLELVSGNGLSVSGDEMTVSANSLLNAGALRVSCPTCTAGLVTANTNVGSASNTFSLSAGAPGLVARGNRGTAGQSPMLVQGTGVEVTQNVMTDTGIGTATGSCYVVQGTEQTLRANTATRCSGSGFTIQGSDQLIDRNIATGAGVSGFVVDGSAGTHNVTLTGNRASQNAGQGFAITTGAANNTLTGNTALGHRYDLCDEGTGTDWIGHNTFGPANATCFIVD